MAHVTGSFAVYLPLDVFCGVELLLAGPLGGGGPGLTTSPVADPILISRVDEDFEVGVVEHIGNLGHEVGHPVAEEGGVDKGVALNPLAASNSKDSLDIFAVEEGVGGAEVVTERRGVAWDTDVVHVELGVERVADAGVGHDLAGLKGGDVEDLEIGRASCRERV